jgi:hypothetical protein
MTNQEQELSRLGQEVRKQGGQGTGTSMKDLVFDPVSGEFKQVSKTETPESGEVVTRMTEEGFALRA